MSELKDILSSGIDKLGMTVDDTKINQLINLLLLLQKWNKTFNLTAVTNPRKMVIQHLLDSLALSPYIHGKRILDVGTGAGFPGLPLAITHSEYQFVLLDSNLKKTRFVQQAALELGINNVKIVHIRIQDYRPNNQFDSVIARAVSSLVHIVDNVARLVADDGKLLLPKGQFPQTEIEELNNCQYSVIKLDIPGMDAQRHLVSIHC